MPISIPETGHLKPELAKSLGLSIAREEPANIGNPADYSILVDVTDQSGLVWVHGMGANPQSAFPAMNNIGAEILIYGAPVKVRRTERGYEIRGKDTSWDTFIAGVYPHDQQPVNISQIMYGTLQPTSPTKSMKALVIGAFYRVGDSTYHVKDQETGDWSSGIIQDTSTTNIVIPTTNGQALNVLFQIDPSTGTLSYKQSSAFPASLSRNAAYDAGFCPAADTNRVRLGYLRLVAGMSIVDFDNLWCAPDLLFYTQGNVTQLSDLSDVTSAGTTNRYALMANGSAYIGRALQADDYPTMVGDSGSGGTKGAVPAPSAGDATKYLKGDGTFDTPASSGGTTILSSNTILSSTAASISFSSISGSYAHLKIRGQLRTDYSGAYDNFHVNFNSDTGSNYDFAYTYTFASAGGGASGGTPLTGQTTIVANAGCAAANATSGYYAIYEIDILNYASTTYNRQVHIRTSYMDAVSSEMYESFTIGVWANTANAISSIQIVPENGTNFVAGSSHELIGIS